MTVGLSFTNQVFFNSEWDFFTAPDPTHGNVQYVDRSEALSSGLASVRNGSVIIAVDDTNQVPVGGNRKS